MAVKNELEWIWAEEDMNLIEVIFQHLPSETKENQEEKTPWFIEGVEWSA
jgi:hypothetical protein